MGELADEHMVIVPDRLGYGSTGGKPGGFSANAVALARLLRSMEVTGAIVVGHSWAGAVALQMAVDFPQMVSALVLVSSVAPGDLLGPLDRLLARRAVGTTLVALTLSTAGTVLSWGPGRAYAGRRLGRVSPGDLEEVARSARSWRRPSTWASFAVEQRALLHELPILSSRLATISAPTVVVVGTADRVVPPASGRRLARSIPGASLRRVEGAGHLLPQRYPTEVARAVRQATTL